MPKEIVSAADVLGQQDAATPVAEMAPVAEAPVQKESSAPDPGFETPPPAEEEAPAEQAASVVSESAPETQAEPPAEVVSESPVEKPDEVASAADVIAAAASGSAPKTDIKPAADAKAPVLSTQAAPPASADEDKGDETDKATEEPAAPAAPAWKFIKNIHPGEKIILKDGTEYPFPKAGVHTVTDPDVAAKILEVASVYHIVQQ